jgi:GNAT superfamily N-acetyltransferase
MNDSLSWTIREASEADIPLLLTLTHAAFEEYETVIKPPTRAHTDFEVVLRATLLQGGAAIVEITGLAVGSIRYELHNDEGFVYLGRLAVLPNYRHHGIGRALIAWVERKAQGLGLNEARLGTYRLLTKNIALYESLGYRVIGYRSRPGQTDDIAMMRKQL